MELLLIGFGFAVTVFMAFVWMGLPALVLAIAKGPRERKLSVFSLSSVPAVLESRTVYEFIQTLKDEAKTSAYGQVMSNMRKLLMDIKKHRQAYPSEIEDLKAFVLSQLRYNIEHSPARDSLETAKFRDLAEQFVLIEVMHEIYVADCKASRTKLPNSLR